ncbi:MAG: ABC transporter permease [Vicinamibacterales bacterium]
MLALVAGALLWEATARTVSLPFMPLLGSILQATWRLLISGEIGGSLAASSGTLAIGYGLAVAVGVPMGLILGRQRWLAVVLNPYLDTLLALPSLLLVPVFFGIFGLGIVTELAVVFCYAFAVIVEVTRSGLSTIDSVYVEMAKVFGASERQIYGRVLLPGTLPAVMTALRLGLARAIRALINTEMLLGTAGLGTLLRQYGSRFDAASTYGILVVLVLIALLAQHAVRMADRRLNRWADSAGYS